MDKEILKRPQHFQTFYCHDQLHYLAASRLHCLHHAQKITSGSQLTVLESLLPFSPHLPRRSQGRTQLCNAPSLLWHCTHSPNFKCVAFITTGDTRVIFGLQAYA